MPKKVPELKYLERILCERDRFYVGQFRSIEKARKLQAAEYARRLDVLNHAHETAVEVQHTYVTQEKYEDYVKQIDTAQDIRAKFVDQRIDSLEKAQTNAAGKRSGQYSIYLYAVGILGILVLIIDIATRLVSTK